MIQQLYNNKNIISRPYHLYIYAYKSILQQVYNRGIGAHKNNPGSVRNMKGVKGGSGKKMSKEQWAYARIYSFVMGGTTRRTADKDLWLKHKSKKKK